ncbi:MAG TPA: CbtA family protein [Kineosporiaceae bacterium]|nr:CbtA family protein [Kineosporiaceae bacterium]
MAKTLLIRGMLVGIVAGFVAFLVGRLFGESALGQAIAVEGTHAGMAGMAGMAEEPEQVSRTVQSTIGLLTATTVFGAALGGIFALVFAFAQGRVLRLGIRALSAVLALSGFVVFYAVPFLKYPPNPPAVGNPDTIGRRTALYFTLLAVSVLIAVLAVIVARRLEPALGIWNASIAGVLLFVVLIGLAEWAMPVSQEVGSDFPAVTLYDFRIASFGIQLSLWTTIGLLFGALTERSMVGRPRVTPSAEVPVP